MISRRKLFGSALGTTAALAGGGAQAVTEVAGSTRSGSALDSAQPCPRKGGHVALRASLEAQLAGRHAPPGSSTSEICPFCGCPIVATVA